MISNTEHFDCKSKGYIGLIGSILKKKYLIGLPLDRGSFGTIFNCVQIETKEKLVIKFQEDYQMLAGEIKSLKKIRGSNTCKMIEYDAVFLTNFEASSGPETILSSYYIMPKYQRNLEGLVFTSSEILKIGVQILDSLEQVHQAERTYNDLKPENIMLEENNKVTLIDFGLCQKYVIKGQHIPENEAVGYFQGNLTFASLNQLRFYSTSRKDDLISLIYLIIYLLNDNKMPFFNQPDNNLSPKQKLQIQVQYKEKYNFENLSENCPPKFREFYQAVEILKFDEKPNYRKLKKILKKCDENYQKSETRVSNLPLMPMKPCINN